MLTPFLSHSRANYHRDQQPQRRSQESTQWHLPEDTQPVGKLLSASCYDGVASWTYSHLATDGGTRYRVMVTRRTERRVEEMSFFPRTILLATDGSDEADLATQAAAELSKATASEVHVTYVLPTEADLIGPHAYTDEIRESLIEQAERDARSLLEGRAERVRSEGGKVAETHLRVGRPDKEIVRLARVLGVGTIVLGSRGLGALDRMLIGSVSESVVRHAHCPVYVVRGDEAHE